MAIIRPIPAGDLKITSGTFDFISGPELVRQRLSSRFKFFLGEYFLDTRQGIPYYRDVFVKFPDLDVIRSLFRKVILTTPGVLSLESFSLNYDDSARELTFDFVALVQGGTVTVTPEDKDFLVSLGA